MKSEEVIRLLWETGIDLFHRGEKGETALDLIKDNRALRDSAVFQELKARFAANE